MPINYMAHVFCTECSNPHSTHIVVSSDVEVAPGQSVADVFDGREVPSEIVALADHQFRCPATGRMFTQKDQHQIFLVRQA